MRLNSETQISGAKTVMVPYRIRHVEKYHHWMESEELLEQTASERLSLEAEYEMQQTWLNDEDKCTFIVLEREKMDKTKNEVESMIGDVNLFLNRDKESNVLVGEISLMIAEREFRGGGRGSEVALHMIRYGVEKLDVNKFIAAISMSNHVSIHLFEKLKFTKESEKPIFSEVTMARLVDDSWKSWLIENTPNYSLGITEKNV